MSDRIVKTMWPQNEIAELEACALAWGRNAAQALRWAADRDDNVTTVARIHQAEDAARKAWRCAMDAETLREMARGE